MRHAAIRQVSKVGVLFLFGMLILQAGCNRDPIHRPVADQLSARQMTLSCTLPRLDGEGLLATDIPLAHTPECGYTEFPAPVLAECREPLAIGIPDMRGIWVDEADPDGHLERIEQCGNRITITAGGVVHDMFADGSKERGVNDVAARDCSAISVRATFEDGVHVLRPEGIPVTVTRELVGDKLIWDYPTGKYELSRVCGP